MAMESKHTSSIESSSAPTPSSLSSSSSIWAEYTTPEGRKYYFNKETKASAWEKPDELKSPEERAIAACPWKEYTTDGRKYYYNTITKQSEWEIPLEYKQALEAARKQMQPQSQGDQSVPREGKDDVQIFKELLSSIGVKPSWSFDNAMSAIPQNDERSRVLKTLSEKKQIFHDYIADLRRAERERSIARDRRVREDYIQLLSEVVTPNMTYRRAIPYLDRDSRFHSLDNDAEREDLFEEFVFDLEKRQREDYKMMRREHMNKLREAFQQDTTITVRTHWREIKEGWKDHSIFRSLERADRLTVFEDHIKDLEKREMEEQRIQRETMRRQHRKNRDAFKALLVEMYHDGAFSLKTRWKTFLPAIREHPALVAMIGQTGSTPGELFMDYIEELEEAYEKDKPKLKGLVKSHTIPVTSKSVFEEFESALSPFLLNSQISTQHRRLYFEDLKEKAIQEEQIEEKRKKKLLDQFVTLLKRNRNLTFNSKWEEVKESLLPQITLASSFGGSGGIESVLSEQERIQAFQDHVAALPPPPPPPSSSSTSPAPTTSTTSTGVLSISVPVSYEAPSGEVKEEEKTGGEEPMVEEAEQPPIAGEKETVKRQDEEDEEGALPDSPTSTKKRTREKESPASVDEEDEQQSKRRTPSNRGGGQRKAASRGGRRGRR